MRAIRFMQLYSNREGAELVARATARLQSDLIHSDCSETVWNAELLRSPKLRLMAAREAAEADFVLVATEQGRRLSVEIRKWLQLWKNRSRVSRSTLVAFLHQASASDSRGVERTLQRFAKAAGMDFFCYAKVGLGARRNRELDPILL